MAIKILLKPHPRFKAMTEIAERRLTAEEKIAAVWISKAVWVPMSAGDPFTTYVLFVLNKLRHMGSEHAMDIHRPKAAHSIREFLIEIGTIVCGILIALGLEQAVEAWHWHEVVGEEREALRNEVAHLSAAMAGRFEIDPCYVRRLEEVKEVIRRHDENLPLGITGPVGRPLYPPTPRPLWELAVADQSLAHMELSEKRQFTDAYDWIPVYEGLTSDERTAWRALQALNHADKLTMSDWSNVREAYENAAETHGIIAGSANGWLEIFNRLGEKAPIESVRHAPSVEAFCRPMLATAQLKSN